MHNFFTTLFIDFSQVRTELREMSQEELASFLDEFNHIIFEMVSSNDVNEKKGGILAIGVYLSPNIIRRIYQK